MSKVNLCDICDFQGGSQPPKSQWTTLQQDGYIRMLQIRDFTQPGKVKAEYVKLTNTTKCCLKDDILIARYGASLGKILTGLSGAYNVAMTKAVPNEAVISKKFLYYFLCSDTFQNCILNVGVRAAQAGFNKEDLSNIELYCPDLSIQNKICKILELVDALINKSKLQLDELDLLVKSRFIEMFGDPITNDKELPVEPLGKHIELLGGFAFKSTGFAKEGIPVLRIGNINSGYFKSDNLPFWKYDKALDRYLLYPGDLAISLTGTVGKDDYGNICRLGNDYPRYYLNQRNAKLILKDTVLPEFIRTLLKNKKVKDKIVNTGVGIRQANISNKSILELEVPIPNLAEQKQFASLVTQVDKSKLAIQQSLDELETLKKSLMQQYFG